MSETRIPVMTFAVEYICDDESCHGKVVFTGTTNPGIDPKNPVLVHRCLKCGKPYMLKGQPYPRHEYEYLVKKGI